MDVYLTLGEGDLLFIDSTHTVKPGSEVNLIILEVLSRLAKGVYVHFHDIYFPYDYKRALMSDGLFFSNESVLLHAFLIGNAHYVIRTSLSMLHYAVPSEFEKLLSGYKPQENDFGLRSGNIEGRHFPSSLYIQKIL